ncbi:hypothetical protein HPB48_008795 [Haemaphysalis longicornis]|uniref:Secreted protein n=1 Tax=Haemaphysalis longicornis TaxID=44386 RepID=A0A9J6H0F8_HAELO|nr:hypothetical protein HPB48_008795 [Haemaphysalis longicornis]
MRLGGSSPVALLLRCWMLLAAVAAASTTSSTREDELSGVGDTAASTAAVNTLTTLECHRREYSFRATRSDAKGNRCWDDITAMSCWGRCDSGEVGQPSYSPALSPCCRRSAFTEVR